MNIYRVYAKYVGKDYSEQICYTYSAEWSRVIAINLSKEFPVPVFCIDDSHGKPLIRYKKRNWSKVTPRFQISWTVLNGIRFSRVIPSFLAAGDFYVRTRDQGLTRNVRLVDLSNNKTLLEHVK